MICLLYETDGVLVVLLSCLTALRADDCPVDIQRLNYRATAFILNPNRKFPANITHEEPHL